VEWKMSKEFGYIETEDGHHTDFNFSWLE